MDRVRQDDETQATGIRLGMDIVEDSEQQTLGLIGIQQATTVIALERDEMNIPGMSTRRI